MEPVPELAALVWCLLCALAVWPALTEQGVSREGDPPLLTFRVSWGLWCLAAETGS